MGRSLAARIGGTPAHLIALLATLSQAEAQAVPYAWQVWGREKQFAPAGDWRTWLILAGRGFGKTRCGAEWVRQEIESGRRGRLALVARTAGDVRDVIVEGESGIMAISPPWFRPHYEPSKRRLTWPNGAIATTYSADEPDSLRGPQHDGAWGDEIAAWADPDAWDQLMLGLRLGNDPKCVATTTPRAIPLIRKLIADPSTVTVRGSTFENAANLAPVFLDEMLRKYKGTRLGRQELYAELLEDVPGALWQREKLDQLRVQALPSMCRVVVAIDPAVTHGEDSDETGIVVAGLGEDGHAYVLSDLTCKASPDAWARRAVKAYHDHEADRIVAERNQGGDMVEHTIRTVDPRVSYKSVVAKRGKYVRAEPVAALYEQGKVHHVGGLPELEDQMCRYVPEAFDGSPDRVDALVWALTDLMLGEGAARFEKHYGGSRRA